jgi:hypothetical protein
MLDEKKCDCEGDDLCDICAVEVFGGSFLAPAKSPTDLDPKYFMALAESGNRHKDVPGFSKVLSDLRDYIYPVSEIEVILNSYNMGLNDNVSLDSVRIEIDRLRETKWKDAELKITSTQLDGLMEKLNGIKRSRNVIGHNY